MVVLYNGCMINVMLKEVVFYNGCLINVMLKLVVFYNGLYDKCNVKVSCVL